MSRRHVPPEAVRVAGMQVGLEDPADQELGQRRAVEVVEVSLGDEEPADHADEQQRQELQHHGQARGESPV